jgi:hypothetical protein
VYFSPFVIFLTDTTTVDMDILLSIEVRMKPWAFSLSKNCSPALTEEEKDGNKKNASPGEQILSSQWSTNPRLWHSHALAAVPLHHDNDPYDAFAIF